MLSRRGFLGVLSAMAVLPKVAAKAISKPTGKRNFLGFRVSEEALKDMTACRVTKGMPVVIGRDGRIAEASPGASPIIGIAVSSQPETAMRELWMVTDRQYKPRR